MTQSCARFLELESCFCRLEARTLVLQCLPGPMKDLTAIGRAFLQHAADFAKRVLKYFVQKKPDWKRIMLSDRYKKYVGHSMTRGVCRRMLAGK